ncbi:MULTISPECIES: helix-turn-helix domain-containing protein [Providencia]|uniref:Helix-turn-helix domain-containing protein n=1 Tax=Providencia stuartii TaxID=588 RepID=A0AAI9I2T1_PROST|nr:MULTISPECIES: helix-turn-helix domain-containing protein [Providencia]ELR5037244.1 helix-turn-helix domain-containing protein [Providencia stuartii]MBG5920250.1 helix-turn-helix domain-containing protein [Providencia stuartii]
MDNRELNSIVSLYFKNLRKKNGMTGYQLAKKLGLSQQQLSRYETGKVNYNITLINQLMIELNGDWADFIAKTVNVNNQVVTEKTIEENNIYLKVLNKTPKYYWS